MNFVANDLRRIAASHMTGMCVSRMVVAKILNNVLVALPAYLFQYCEGRVNGFMPTGQAKLVVTSTQDLLISLGEQVALSARFSRKSKSRSR